jgi:hypothetical protein
MRLGDTRRSSCCQSPGRAFAPTSGVHNRGGFGLMTVSFLRQGDGLRVQTQAKAPA